MWTNNLYDDGPNFIAKAILSMGKTLLEKSLVLKMILTGILSRDKNIS